MDSVLLHGLEFVAAACVAVAVAFPEALSNFLPHLGRCSPFHKITLAPFNRRKAEREGGKVSGKAERCQEPDRQSVCPVPDTFPGPPFRGP